ncbi:MAG: sugar phosphate nucleotidyltransferase [Candidatus Delongbacteria bacterium]|jgi:NDP-sugar pyrophosphorylase family protein|nr:sugar phosphate nucleotidyltransferase [Candidatus Delongbacteria bacterium]
MKCLINCTCENSNWVDRYFKDIHPYLLKFCNKPLLEYYIDFCKLNKIKAIRVVSDHKLNEIEEYFGNGISWGVLITYSVSKPEDPIENIISKNKKFIDNDDLMVISDMIFIDYDAKGYKPAVIKKGEMILSETSHGKLMFIHKDAVYSDNTFIENTDIKLVQILSVNDYWNLSMDNITIDKSSYFGENVILKEDVEIENNSIIGDNVIIDSYTHINNSIVYDNTYVGSGLTLDKKILYRNTLIDPESGQRLEVDDDILASEIINKSNYDRNYKLIHKFFAVILIAMMLIPYVILRVLLFVFGDLYKVEHESFITKEKKLFTYYSYRVDNPNLIESLFFKLSLDKFHLLFEVLKGNLYLSGNSILGKNLIGRRLLRDMKVYHPSVFSYIISLKIEDEIIGSISELYYSSNFSIWVDLKIIVKCLFINLFRKIT